MEQTTLYQLTINAEKSVAADIAILLENIEPAPLSVSHFENEKQKWLTTAHYDFKPNKQTFHELIKQSLGHNQQSYKIDISELENKDWVSHVQSRLKPVRAGRFFVHGSHDTKKAKNESLAIKIDAAQAFGTAHHGTTKGCLIALDQLATQHPPKSILDLGTGTGILAIAASQLWPEAKILATDIDPIAIKVAQKNIEENCNHTQNKIKTHCADGLEDQTIQNSAPFQLLIANILAVPLIAMAPNITKVMAPRGYAIFSGILDHQADNVCRTFIDSGLTHTSTTLYGEWATILCEKV